jgi:hypothetical protein
MQLRSVYEELVTTKEVLRNREEVFNRKQHNKKTRIWLLNPGKFN